MLEGRDRQVQRDRQPRPVEAQPDQQPRRVESGRSSEFSQFPASNNDPLEALRRLTPSGQRPTATRPSSQVESLCAVDSRLWGNRGHSARLHQILITLFG